MYCRKCGTWCEDSAVFCTQCGDVLGEKTTNKSGQGTGVANDINYGYGNNTYGGTVYMGSRNAGFWKRFLAVMIDGIILAVVEGIIGAMIGGIIGFKVLSTLNTLIGWVYFAYMESSEYQATLGKMALHLKVTDIDGGRINFARATARYFSKILSGFILCIGYMMAGWTAKKQALHDIIASTLVVVEE